MGGEVTMRQDRAAADRILAQHAEWVGPWELDMLMWGVYEGSVLVAFHPMNDTTAMVHIAAERGTPGTRVFRGLTESLRWFRGEHPEVKKLVGFIREDNTRALRAAEHMGFSVEGKISDYIFKNGNFYGILIVGKRQ